MADFQISLLDGTGAVALSASSGVLTISDYSNYIASTESGHLLASFSLFKKVYIESPTIGQYILSTLGDGDELIAVPSTYVVTPLTHSYLYIYDDIYKVTLMAVPTWSAAATYQLNDCVYYIDTLYIALATTTNNIPLSSPTYWESITEDDLPSKYSTFGHIAIIDTIMENWADAVYDANCTDEGINVSVCPDENICKNEFWRKAARMDNLINSIPYFVNLKDWQRTQELIDKLEELEDC